jgi:hypothetical protein
LSSWRFVAEAEADPAFFAHLAFWALQALIATLPLGGLSVILHRAGRKGVWPSFPWALAILCGPVYNMILFWVADQGFFSDGFIVGWVASWASGAYISLCLSVVLFAVIGLAPPPKN